MSATETTPQKMSGQEAHSLMTREVFAPAFFDKLASHGIKVNTPEEAERYLSMGQKLLAADRQEQVKAASNRVNFLKQAETDLDRELQRRYGTAPGAPSPAEDYIAKNAEFLGSNPVFQQAVEDYNDAVLAEAGQ
jgi:hypothetical protein